MAATPWRSRSSTGSSTGRWTSNWTGNWTRGWTRAWIRPWSRGAPAEGRAGPRGSRAAAAGAGGEAGPGLGSLFGGEWAVYTPPPLPPVERGPASLQQSSLRVPDGAPAFTAPLYLRHRARQKAESLDPALADYAERFATASSAAFKIYDQVLGRMRSLNNQARSGEDRRAGARQRALDTVLDGLARDFDRARDVLSEARSRQKSSLAIAVMSTRERIRTAASNGVGSLSWRARKVDRDIEPLHGRERAIIAKPTDKAAELDEASAAGGSVARRAGDRRRDRVQRSGRRVRSGDERRRQRGADPRHQPSRRRGQAGDRPNGGRR